MDIRGDKECLVFSKAGRQDRGRGLGGAIRSAGREWVAAICRAPYTCGSVVRHAGGPRCPRFPRRSGIGWGWRVGLVIGRHVGSQVMFGRDGEGFFLFLILYSVMMGRGGGGLGPRARARSPGGFWVRHFSSVHICKWTRGESLGCVVFGRCFLVRNAS